LRSPAGPDTFARVARARRLLRDLLPEANHAAANTRRTSRTRPTSTDLRKMGVQESTPNQQLSGNLQPPPSARLEAEPVSLVMLPLCCK
jgi:hypothetical protein